jgi:hypothetical protein
MSEKPMGRVKKLSSDIEAYMKAGLYNQAQPLIWERNAILTNGYQPPVPAKMLNQRQIRKRKRQQQKH